MWAASAALVPASTSGSRNTLAVSLFETRSIGEAVMAVWGSPDAKPIVTGRNSDSTLTRQSR